MAKSFATGDTATAFCPFCATGNATIPGDLLKARITGPIVTPVGEHTIDLSTATDVDFAEHRTVLDTHRAFDGRPAIEHRCPVAGHQVFIYPDTAGGSLEEVSA